ncbi:MAG: peptidoglycan DD-metalloendopeptidase family protein, partial [Gracilibacteraceae bacterium]|nr:peptidoglycan DD-metalloendopeptidase family protein [Gracilibacteraceae bacterium]
GIRAAGRTFRHEAGLAVREFRGSQDVGMQALVRTKNAISKAPGVLRGARRVIRILSNPLTYKIIAVLILVAVVFNFIMGGVSAIASVIPVISLKSAEQELTDTWVWITELDTDLAAEIFEIESLYTDIDDFHYYLNGRNVALSRMKMETSAELLMAYLDSKYDDYSLGKIIVPPAGLPHSIRDEIERLHRLLYTLTAEEWTEIISTPDSDPDDDVDDSSEEIIYHLDVRLTTTPFADYLADNADALLTPAEMEKLNVLTEVGFFTTHQEIGSPFPDEGWVVSDNFGYRLHPVYHEKRLHTGLDIAKPLGTNVYACHSGTAAVGVDSSYGLWVRIDKSNGDNTFYAHLSSRAVADGDAIRKGDLIGQVGSTGVSTGPHLHLEYEKKGKKLNPLFYLPGQLPAAAFIGNINTHKFHKPTCWTLPNPENRVYFSGRDGAVTAGYVPCLNCRP